MRLLTFRACLLATVLLLVGCGSAPVAKMCDPFEPPNCAQYASYVIVHPD